MMEGLWELFLLVAACIIMTSTAIGLAIVFGAIAVRIETEIKK